MKKPNSLYKVLEEITAKDLRYPEKAYLFVLSALNRTIDALPEPRHVTGRELSEECRKLALEEFGPLALTVLEHWEIRSTSDFGELIFNLLDYGILTKTDKDSREDFAGVFDFNEAFEVAPPGGESPREKEEGN